MKLVGILKEYEPGLIKVGKSLTEFHKGPKASVNNLDKIIYYLDSNQSIISFLHNIFVNGKPIGSLIIYTDGKWIWPSYLKYFLKEGYFSLLPDDFIGHIKKNEFKAPLIGENEIKEAQMYYKNVYI